MIQKSKHHMLRDFESEKVSEWGKWFVYVPASMKKKPLISALHLSILSFNQQFNCRPTEIDIWLRVHSHVIGRSFVYAAKSTNQSSCRAFMYVMYRCNMSASCQYVTRYGSSPKPDSSLIPFLFFTSFVCHTSSMYSPQLQLFWTCFS